MTKPSEVKIVCVSATQKYHLPWFLRFISNDSTWSFIGLGDDQKLYSYYIDGQQWDLIDKKG